MRDLWSIVRSGLTRKDGPGAGYSIVVFSGTASAPRKYTLSRRQTQAAFGASLLFAAAVIWIAVDYFRIWRMPEQVMALAGQAKDLAAENAQYKLKIEELQAAQGTVEQRIGKLAVMVGVETLPGLGSVSGIGGVGGAEAPDLAAPVDSAQKAQAVLATLEKRQSLFEQSMGELETVFSKKQSLLSFIPSIWPVEGLVTAGRGWRRDPFTGSPEFHSGLDISARAGAPIKAPAEGVVSDMGYNAGYGNTLVVSHGFGYLTRYAHLNAFNVKPGQRIKRGDVIGFVGTTGRSTGPHLHYEVLLNGEQVNPRNFIVEDARQF